MVQSAAMVVFVLGVLGVVFSIAVPGRIGTGTNNAICKVFGGCGGGGTTAGGKGAAAVLNPAPGVNPAPAPPGGAGPGPQAQQTRRVVRETQRGRAALERLRRLRVPVVYIAGGGSYYDPAARRIVLDPDQTAEERAAVLIHESNHAGSDRVARNDPRRMTRDNYVRASLEEETTGTVQAIRQNQELARVRQANGQPLPADTLGQPEYEAAYRDGVNREVARRRRAGLPPPNAAQRRDAGERAGRLRILRGFENGDWVTSTNGQTYPDYYGAIWDAAHPHP